MLNFSVHNLATASPIFKGFQQGFLFLLIYELYIHGIYSYILVKSSGIRVILVPVKYSMNKNEYREPYLMFSDGTHG